MAIRYQYQPDEIFPASTIVDEDFWQNPVAPVLATFYRTLPLADLDEIIVATIGQPDEDFWVNWVNPVQATFYQKLPLVPDPEELPAGSLYGQPDEDFWDNWVNPVPTTLYQKLPLGDVEEIPAGSLYGQPDEDFWNNPVNPVQATFYQKLPLGDPEEIPAGSLYGQPDEDFWKNPVAPVLATFYRTLPLADLDEIIVATIGQPDEDFWLPNPQIAFTFTRFTTPDDDFVAPIGIFDEDFWNNPVLPVLPVSFAIVALADSEIQYIITFDEEFWQNPVVPVLAQFYQKLPLIPDPEEIPVSAFIADEHFWQNPVNPVPLSLYQKLPLIPDPEELPAGSLYGQPDEDFWVSWVNPIPLTLYQKLPIPNWDVEEIPAGNLISLTINPDEDFWQNSVTPTQATFYQKLPLGDPEEIPAGELIGPLLNPDPPILTTMWRLASNPLPEARYLHGSLLHNNFVYVASGQGDLNTPPTTVYTDVKVARLENAGQDVGQWKIANSFIGVRQGCGMVGWGNYVAILGGSNATASPTRTNTILVGQQNFDGTISSWTTQYMPIQLSQYGLVQANNGVYIIGGINQASNPVTSIYFAILNANGTIEKWHYLSDLPTPAIAQNSVAFTNDFMYVLSGNTLYYAPTFDFMIGTWKSQTLNFSRTGQYLLVRDNKLIILGGNDGTNTTSSVKLAAIYGDGRVGQFFEAEALLRGAFTATTSTILTASQSTAAPREGFGLCLSGIQVGIFIPGNKMILLGGRNSNTVMSDVYVGTL